MVAARRVVFLCSGSGGNFHFVRACIARGLTAGLEMGGVIIDRPGGLANYCAHHGINYAIKSFAKDQQETELLPILQDWNTAIIITNVNRKVVTSIIDSYAGMIYNLHYSLLPAFSGLIGMKPVQAALDHACQLVGCTTHHVTSDIDAGQPIAQCAIAVGNARIITPMLSDAVFRVGAICLLATISAAVQNVPLRPRAFCVHGFDVLYSGPDFRIEHFLDDEELWTDVRIAASKAAVDGNNGNQP